MELETLREELRMLSRALDTVRGAAGAQPVASAGPPEFLQAYS